MPRQSRIVEVDAEFDAEFASELDFDDEAAADFAERLEAGFDLLHGDQHDEPSQWWTRRNK